jgi:hypothetical protein
MNPESHLDQIGTAKQALHERSQRMSLKVLQKETGLSRNTIVRARRGQRVHPRSLESIRIAMATAPFSR